MPNMKSVFQNHNTTLLSKSTTPVVAHVVAVKNRNAC